METVDLISRQLLSYSNQDCDKDEHENRQKDQ